MACCCCCNCCTSSLLCKHGVAVMLAVDGSRQCASAGRAGGTPTASVGATMLESLQALQAGWIHHRSRLGSAYYCCSLLPSYLSLSLSLCIWQLVRGIIQRPPPIELQRIRHTASVSTATLGYSRLLLSRFPVAALLVSSVRQAMHMAAGSQYHPAPPTHRAPQEPGARLCVKQGWGIR